MFILHRMEIIKWYTTISLLLVVTEERAENLDPWRDDPTAIQDFTNALLPRFAEPIPNITVSLGRDALMACVVDNLRERRVAWVRIDTQTILTIHHSVIAHDPRISLSFNNNRSWYLHIRNVQEKDRGWYMCQVNTDPMLSRAGFLQVVVPPRILNEGTSSDVVLREGSNVTLLCSAEGFPEPKIMWRREDGGNILYLSRNESVIEGDTLTLTRVNRHHMGAYLCIASNGVPPSISKRIMVMVQYPPMLYIANQLEGAYLGQDVILECRSEAYPRSISYWTDSEGHLIHSGDKFESVSMSSDFNNYLMLKIRNIRQKDFGVYNCISKNPFGETEGSIKLEEIPAPTVVPTTTPSTTTAVHNNGRRKGKHFRDRHQDDQGIEDFGLEEWRDSDYVESEFSMPSKLPPSDVKQFESSSSRDSTTKTFAANHMLWRLVVTYLCRKLILP